MVDAALLFFAAATVVLQAQCSAGTDGLDDRPAATVGGWPAVPA